MCMYVYVWLCECVYLVYGRAGFGTGRSAYHLFRTFEHTQTNPNRCSPRFRSSPAASAPRYLPTYLSTYTHPHIHPRYQPPCPQTHEQGRRHWIDINNAGVQVREQLARVRGGEGAIDDKFLRTHIHKYVCLCGWVGLLVGGCRSMYGKWTR